jgi:hypothetical protein
MTQIIRLILILFVLSFSTLYCADDTTNLTANKTAVQSIATIIKSSIDGIPEESLNKLLLDGYRRMWLLDEDENWKHPRLEEISDRLIARITERETKEFIDQVALHAAENPFLVRFLENAVPVNFATLRADFDQDQAKPFGDQTKFMPRAIAYAIALNRLTLAQVDDYRVLAASIEIFREVRKQELTLFDMNLFTFAKLYSVEGPVRKFVKFHQIKDRSYKREISKGFLSNLLPLNIYEAILVDKYYKPTFKQNAQAARPLMKNGPSSLRDNVLDLEPPKWSEDGKEILISLPQAKEWTDLYQTWNMAFMSRFNTFPFFIVKLLIPSVSNYKARPKQFIYRRAISLYNHLHYFFLGNIYDQKHGIPSVTFYDLHLTEMWGEYNLKAANEYSLKLNSIKDQYPRLYSLDLLMD